MPSWPRARGRGPGHIPGWDRRVPYPGSSRSARRRREGGPAALRARSRASRHGPPRPREPRPRGRAQHDGLVAGRLHRPVAAASASAGVWRRCGTRPEQSRVAGLRRSRCRDRASSGARGVRKRDAAPCDDGAGIRQGRRVGHGGPGCDDGRVVVRHIRDGEGQDPGRSGPSGQSAALDAREVLANGVDLVDGAPDRSRRAGDALLLGRVRARPAQSNWRSRRPREEPGRGRPARPPRPWRGPQGARRCPAWSGSGCPASITGIDPGRPRRSRAGSRQGPGGVPRLCASR